MGEQNVRLAERLVAIGWSRDDMAVVLDEFRTDIEIFREANVPLFAELEEHSAAYQKITGGLEAEWEGERVTIPQLQPHLKVRDRAVRERAFRLGAEAYLAQREALAALFDTMFALRQRLAANAGFANYMEYAFRAKHRFDYSPADCARFHAAVEATAAPAVERLMAHRRESLGVATVRPWDTLVQLESERPVRPLPRHGRFRGAGQAHLRCARPGAGGSSARWQRPGCSTSRADRARPPAAIAPKLPWRGRPFIFMNAVGVPDDVNTLVHEAGHSFHDFAAHRQPFIWQRGTGHEAAELASMSMELLVTPHLTQPTGYHAGRGAGGGDRAARGRAEQPGAHRQRRRLPALDLHQRRGARCGGARCRLVAAAGALRARRGLVGARARAGVALVSPAAHLRVPVLLHRVRHCAARRLAVVARRAARPGGDDAALQAGARPGGTRGLPEIYAAAGARLIFDEAGMRELVDLWRPPAGVARGHAS
ncbi:MAG: hypothetical protein IPK33_09030 [Gemmatimonadetes bacterium]|nr:hypothetical protein [Gemmatimonadota bacterium]